MVQPLSKTHAKTARAATPADDLERDRIAWNLPLSTVDEALRLANRDQQDGPHKTEPRKARG